MHKTLFLMTVIFLSCNGSKDLTDWGIPEIEEDRILSNRDLKYIIETIKTEKFKTYKQKQYIPKSVSKLLNIWYGDKVRFASNGDEYRKGCVVTNRKIPSREITTILKSETYFVMTYNHGGRAFHRHILFAELVNDKIAKTIWIGNAFRTLETKDDIIFELECERNYLHTNIVCY